MNPNNDTPSIRFAGFTDAWEQRKLCSMTSYQNGKGYEECQSDSGKFALINLNSISINGGLKESGKYVNEATETLELNDLVMVLSDVGHGDLLGRVALIPESNKFVLNQRVALLRPLEESNPQFLFTCINASQSYFKKNGAGSSQLNISKGVVENFSPSIPRDRNEQDKIGILFRNFDTLITLHQRKYDQLVNIKKSMLEKMFPKNGELVPEVRFAGFTDAWEQRKVSEIATFSKGTGYSKSDIRDKGTPLILYGRLYTKYETVIREVDTFAIPKDGSVYSRGGEVIIPASGETAEDISIASVVEKSGVILGGDLNIITPQSGIDSAFLALSISHGEAHRSLSKLAQGKSVVHIHNSDIQTVEVSIPELSEQESISQFFERVDTLITLHQRKLERLQNIKKACLEKMFV